MALINLKQIGELSLEALSQKGLADSLCYNSTSKTRTLTDYQFVYLIKTYYQAENLFNKLQKLHQVCTDLAAGQLESYIDEHNRWPENEDIPFDPFRELRWCFDSSSVEDLPPRIEQYTELLELSRRFAHSQNVKWEGFRKFFPGLQLYYQATDANGQTVMIPEGELPDNFRRERAAQEAISAIEMDYCLDQYDQFYAQATGLLKAYLGGDVQQCAAEILRLYRPF